MHWKRRILRWADSDVPPEDGVRYYEAVERTMGGSAQTTDFFRLFMVPGMGHCGGGPGPNIFDAVTPSTNGSSTERRQRQSLHLMSPRALRIAPDRCAPILRLRNGRGPEASMMPRISPVSTQPGCRTDRGSRIVCYQMESARKLGCCGAWPEFALGAEIGRSDHPDKRKHVHSRSCWRKVPRSIPTNAQRPPSHLAASEAEAAVDPWRFLLRTALRINEPFLAQWGFPDSNPAI